jgi:hypothetical protein
VTLIHDFVDEGLGHSSYLIELDDRFTADTHSHADDVTDSFPDDFSRLSEVNRPAPPRPDTWVAATGRPLTVGS